MRLLMARSHVALWHEGAFVLPLLSGGWAQMEVGDGQPRAGQKLDVLARRHDQRWGIDAGGLRCSRMRAPASTVVIVVGPNHCGIARRMAVKSAICRV